MKLSTTTKKAEELTNEALVMMCTEECVKECKDSKIFQAIKDDLIDFKGEKNDVAMSYTRNKISPKRVLIVGLGKRSELNVEKLRKAGDIAVKTIKSLKLENFALIPYRDEKITEKQGVAAAVEGVCLGNYKWEKYKTEDKKTEVKECCVVTKDGELVEQTKIICENVNYARDLVNTNAEDKNSVLFAKMAKQMAKKAKLKCTILEEKQITKLKMGLILAVNRGSRYPPRVVILEHWGDKKSKDVTAIVGKGITFDAGGLNLKPSGYMETMRADMGGAGAVMGIMKTLGELKVKKNVIGVMGLTENMIDSKSYKPGDVFVSHSGKTVEVLNTDAEGRLVLADAMSYVVKKYKPNLLMDLATLTGAIVVTFNNYVMGMFGTCDKTADALFASGQRTYERVWRLPMYEEYKEDMKSDFADIKNISEKRYAGSITAACFLENFTGKTPWVHLDIAGPAYNDKPSSYVPKGASGAGVRLLIDYFLNN